MTLKQRLCLSVAAIGMLAWPAAAPTPVDAQTTVAIDNDDIGGVVTGANGPEAGVWVVAETTDLSVTGQTSHSGSVQLREVLVHLIEEYARHCGHADLLRERIDGRTGQ